MNRPRPDIRRIKTSKGWTQKPDDGEMWYETLRGFSLIRKIDHEQVYHIRNYHALEFDSRDLFHFKPFERSPDRVDSECFCYVDTLDGERIKDGEKLEVRFPDGTETVSPAVVTAWIDAGQGQVYHSYAYVNVYVLGLTTPVRLNDKIKARRVIK